MPRYYFGFSLNILIVRFSKSQGKLSNSRPCATCIRQLYNYGINIANVYYSVDNSFVKEQFSYMLDSKLTKMSSGTFGRLYGIQRSPPPSPSQSQSEFSLENSDDDE